MKERDLLPPLESAPETFDPEAVENKFWTEEEWDQYIPESGWLSDFVLANRGIETPTSFCLWTGISTISNVLKRDAWLQWVPRGLYPNFYILMVGPPKTGKTTIALYSDDLLRRMIDYFPTERLKIQKRVNMFRSRITPEAIVRVLDPKEEPYQEKDGKVGMFKHGSEAAFLVSELSSFLGRQNYNEGLVGKLTDLYDCKDYDDDTTVTRGYRAFEDIYVTMLAGTTQTSLEESIPEQAFGEGFMSRMILVYQKERTRAHPEPRWVRGGPTPEHLAQALAWIGEHSQGEYRLSEPARDAYYQWYGRFHRQLVRDSDQRHAALKDRYDIHLLKVAMIFQIQSYEPGNEISLESFNQAIRLMEGTYAWADRAVENVGSGMYTRTYNRVRGILENKGKATRRYILTSCSGYNTTADLITKVLDHLYQEDIISVRLDGTERRHVSTAGREVYYLNGKEKE